MGSTYQVLESVFEVAGWVASVPSFQLHAFHCPDLV
jgi:hypothetical protein